VKLTCQELIDFLMAYLDKELPTPEREEFERHLGVCPSCVDYMDNYRDAVELGREACKNDDAQTMDVPEDLIKAILAARKAGG